MPCEANFFWLGDDNDDGEAFQPMDREALAQQNASRARPAAGASSASSASSLSVAQKTARKIGKPDDVEKSSVLCQSKEMTPFLNLVCSAVLWPYVRSDTYS